MNDTVAGTEIVLAKTRDGASVTSTMSWETFEQHLRDTGKLHHNECLNSVVVTEHGLQYYIGTR